MICCFNVKACLPELVIQIQNLIWNKWFWPWQFERQTLQNCKSEPWHNDITITGLLTPNFACNYKNISKMADQSQPVNPRMHYVVLTVTSSGCLKLYLNPWELSLFEEKVVYNVKSSHSHNLLLHVTLQMVRCKQIWQLYFLTGHHLSNVLSLLSILIAFINSTHNACSNIIISIHFIMENIHQKQSVNLNI